jgi:hypothetical protein
MHLIAVETRLDEWPLASEPVDDEYTPARPGDVWFEDGWVANKTTQSRPALAVRGRARAPAHPPAPCSRSLAPLASAGPHRILAASHRGPKP